MSELDLSRKTRKWLEGQGYFISKSVVGDDEASGHAMVSFEAGKIGIDHLARKLDAEDVEDQLILVEDMLDGSLSDFISHMARLALALRVYGGKGYLVVPNSKKWEPDLEEILGVFHPNIARRLTIMEVK